MATYGVPSDSPAQAPGSSKTGEPLLEFSPWSPDCPTRLGNLQIDKGCLELGHSQRSLSRGTRRSGAVCEQVTASENPGSSRLWEGGGLGDQCHGVWRGSPQWKRWGSLNHHWRTASHWQHPQPALYKGEGHFYYMPSHTRDLCMSVCVCVPTCMCGGRFVMAASCT